MTTKVTFDNGRSMYFVGDPLSEVLRKLKTSGLKVRLIKVLFHPHTFERELTELAKDIEVYQAEIVN